MILYVNYVYPKVNGNINPFTFKLVFVEAKCFCGTLLNVGYKTQKIFLNTT